MKIHKEGAPLRPVISAVGTATYNTSKYLAWIVSPLVGRNGFVVQNSVQFIERTKGVVMDLDSLMVSFDVKALYTSLPIDITTEIVKRKLADKRPWQERTMLSAEDVIELLKTCLKATYFTFRGNFFHLTDGVAMWSPVSSIVANLFVYGEF